MRVELGIVERGLEVVAEVKCQTLQCGGQIPFLIDTGSHRSFINEEDGRRLGITPEALKRSSEPIWGFGGSALAWYVPEVIIIVESDEGIDWLTTDKVMLYKTPIMKKKGREIRPRMASILGRDYLEDSKFKLVVDMSNKKAHLEK